MQLVIGTVQFSQKYGITNNVGKTSEDIVRKILKIAKANNINFLDTALAYDYVDKLLGDIGVDDFNIISKLLPIKQNTENIEEHIVTSVNETLKNLKKKNYMQY